MVAGWVYQKLSSDKYEVRRENTEVKTVCWPVGWKAFDISDARINDTYRSD